MDPTRIDPKKSARPTLLKAASTAQSGSTSKAQGTATAAAPAEATSGASVSAQSAGLAEAKSESRRIDARRFEELREAIKNDTYKVDIGGLARLMVEEGLGPEGAE